MDLFGDFHGPNSGYVLELYDRYRRDPDSVDAATRALFSQWTPSEDGARAVATPPGALAAPDVQKIVGAANLAQAIRQIGHLSARLDPLGTPHPGDPALDPAAHGLTEDDLRRLPATLIGGPIADRAANAFEAIEGLRRVYSSTIGFDFLQIRVPEERDWLRDAAESGRFRPDGDPAEQRALLERLTQVETFERFLHRIFAGKTRFSIEGLDAMVPILDEVIGGAANSGTLTVLIGIAHRGRLNVLAHVLDKPYAQILAEFKDPVDGRTLGMRGDLGWTGDVKYHLGGRQAQREDAAGTVIAMPPNPSHLEAVNPVVEGMARAAGTRVDGPGPPRFDPRVTLPILVHGDASFTGQGVVAETLNFSRLPGYRTGGTLHVIANNQLGYTTPPGQLRSTLYASDLAKGFRIPVVHVNADSVEACIEVARMAIAYRARFLKDFLVDLIGYRRYGHNEGDEPSFTQPVMYARIDDHPSVRRQWADALVERGVVTPDEPERLVQERMQELQRVLETLEPAEALAEPLPKPPPPGAARRVKTAVPAERLRRLNEALLRLPEGFSPHPKLQRAMQRRLRALDDPNAPSIDWATAEDLAFGSILEDGVSVRLTGEDVERGTFSQRHAVFHDHRSGDTYTPLQALPQSRAAFEIRNSPLSEFAALGFEYGYNVQAPERLVVWEAQYGDFINGAQVVVDEFIASARAKWGQTPSLVLLLPHAHEGQGPDHTSGRLERFLSLAADTNMRIANCTTAAQHFHLLRRQAALLEIDPLPLVVMTPKSLLRHPRVASPLRDLAEGGWQPVIDDPEARDRADRVRRLVLCSGKVYVDLIASDRRKATPAVAIARVEQLYPFPAEELRGVLDGYPRLNEVVWVQEEPENMGAWEFVRPLLAELLDDALPLRHIARPRSSSPAEGSSAWHALNQRRIVEEAFEGIRALEAGDLRLER